MKTINIILELIADLLLVVAVLLCDVMWVKCVLAGAFLLLARREED